MLGPESRVWVRIEDEIGVSRVAEKGIGMMSEQHGIVDRWAGAQGMDKDWWRMPGVGRGMVADVRRLVQDGVELQEVSHAAIARVSGGYNVERR